MPERVTMSNRSEKSAEVVVVRNWAGEAETTGEGPNEKECLRSCRCKTECVRCPGNRGGWQRALGVGGAIVTGYLKRC